MNSPKSHHIELTPRAVKGLRTLLLVAAFAMLAGACFAGTPAPTDASLDGTYVFHFSNVKEVNWYKTVTCSYPKAKYTFTGGGQSVDSEIIMGEATFDGKGHVSINFTDYHKFDESASNATVSIACPAKEGAPPNIDNGQLVFEAPSSGTYTGTYSVKSNGSAAITLPDGEGYLGLNLAAFNSAGLSTTVLIDNPDGTDGFLSGIAVHK
jgi:hypothetical protein